MTARQPRRTRRRTAPPSALPRPTSVALEEPPEDAADDASRRSSARGRLSTPGHRQHHVTKDYSYVHRDLLTILGVGLIVLAFIVGMSFVIA